MNDERDQGRGLAGRPGTAPALRQTETDLLAERAHRMLRQLPARRAPATLAPRVMAELARRAKLIWYRRPWTDWPELMRWLSTFLLAGIVAGTLRLIEGGWSATKASPSLAGVEDVPAFLSAAETCTRSLLTVAQSLPSTWWLVGGSAFGIIALGTLGLGTAAWRLVRSSAQ